MAKRKSGDYTSDDDGFVANDSDAAADRGPKRSKTQTKPNGFSSPTAMQTDEEGNQYWELSKVRRVTVSEFKGKRMVSIREYYEKDGKALPGRKGISMTMEQYSAFIELLPHIEGVLTKKGERVPRPDYDGTKTATEEAMDDEASEEDEDKKANIEATSDEDEGRVITSG